MPKWTDEQMDAITRDNSNIIVSAGAGSGKTAVLSERVLRKIKDGVHINELLILTFTNAAAKEMKDRIRRKLIKEGLTKEIELLDSSYITTFDSYSLSVLKKYHYLLNVDKNIKIVDSDLINYKKEIILDKIFEEYYASDNDNFNKLINDFCMKDDDNIKKGILSISSKIDLLLDSEDYLNTYLDKYYNDEYLNTVIDDLNNSLVNKINTIKMLLKNISYYVDNDFYEKYYDSFINLLNSNNYVDIKNSLNISTVKLTNGTDEAKKYKEQIKKELDEIKNICIYSDTEEIKKDILSTKCYVSIIIDIIKRLNKEVLEFKKENDLYEFNDIAKMSIKLLKENTNIREEIKNSYNEIMIDEYQDTNDIQEAFISLISHNNVYMVGDIKQSIYRFRNANPNIFKDKYDRYSNNDNGVKIDLNKNFRSREETLDNINRLFNLIMDKNIGGADYKYGHQMIFGNDSYNTLGKTDHNNNFEIYNYDYDKELGFTREENEIFLIAKDIRNKVDNHYKIYDKDNNLLRDVSYNDFVILLDRSKSFDLYKKIFELFNIPLTIYKDETINEDIILTIIKNFLVCSYKINSNEIDSEFKHSFISLLRSPIFEYSDSDIFDIYVNNDYRNNDLYKKIKNIKVDSMTTKELLYYIIDEFNIINSLIKIGDIKNKLVLLEYIIDYVSTKEELGFTPKDFALYLGEVLDKRYDIKYSMNFEDSSSVKIMTIHKSKGLEYSICYYAGLYNEFNIRDLNDRFMFDNKYGIITPCFNEGIYDSIYKYLIKENTIKEEISEKIRLFYVALTRAKEKMIIVADLNKDEFNTKNDEGIIDDTIRLKYRSFLDIIVSVKDYLKEYITDIDDIEVSKDYLISKNIDLDTVIEKNENKIDIIDYEKDNTLVSESKFSKVQNKILSKEEINTIKYGTEVHSIFEYSDFYNPKEEIVINFLKEYDFKNPKNIYKEYEFVFSENNERFHGIIDLMFEYEDYIDIIDYKLKSIDDEAYVKQLDGYKKVIEEKTGKTVNAYLYSIINNELKKL